MQTVPSLVRAPHSNVVGEKKKRQWKLGPVFEGFAVRIAVRKIKDGRTSADLLGISCIRVLAQAGSAETRTIQAEGQIPKGVNWHNPTGSNRATAQGFCWKFILSSWLPQAEQIKVQQSTPGMGLCRRGQGIYWGTKHHHQIWIGLNSYFFSHCYASWVCTTVVLLEIISKQAASVLNSSTARALCSSSSCTKPGSAHTDSPSGSAQALFLVFSLLLHITQLGKSLKSRSGSFPLCEHMLLLRKARRTSAVAELGTKGCYLIRTSRVIGTK